MPGRDVCDSERRAGGDKEGERDHFDAAAVHRENLREHSGEKKGSPCRGVPGPRAERGGKLKEGIPGGCRQCEKFRNADPCCMARQTSAVTSSDTAQFKTAN